MELEETPEIVLIYFKDEETSLEKDDLPINGRARITDSKFWVFPYVSESKSNFLENIANKKENLHLNIISITVQLSILI